MVFSESLSTSLAVTVPVMVVSSSPLAAPSAATGGSLAMIVRLTVATLLSSVPSLTLKVKLSLPLYPLSGA